MAVSNRVLLNAGIVAGPLWVVISFAQAFTREGFDIVRHPASLLLRGNLGWLEIIAFVLAGALYILSAVGVKRAISGIGHIWAPITLGIFGFGMIIGGAFRPDPALGFPPGTPLGIPATMSISSQIHGMAPIVAFIALTVCFCIFARRFFNQGRKLLAWSALVIGFGSLVSSIVPNITADMQHGIFNFLPLWIGASIGFLWVSVVLTQIKQGVAGS